VCSVVCDHDGDWTWPDFDFVDGLCAAIGLWQHIRTLTVRQVTLARIGTPQRIPHGGLTARQRSVLALIGEGKSNASITGSAQSGSG
jgi:DNA-binding NarL/FixJ family response regulator